MAGIKYYCQGEARLRGTASQEKVANPISLHRLAVCLLRPLLANPSREPAAGRQRPSPASQRRVRRSPVNGTRKLHNQILPEISQRLAQDGVLPSHMKRNHHGPLLRNDCRFCAEMKTFPFLT